MSARTVYVEPGGGLAATHRAALATLPADFTLAQEPLHADILAGSAAFMHEQISNGANAKIAVLVAPRAEAWDDVDALWAAVEYRDVRVLPAAIDVDAIAPLAPLVASLVNAATPFRVELHLESLGTEETRLAQVVQLLHALGITCPEASVEMQSDGWVASAEDARMRLRAHCVASAALAPRIRIRLTNAAQEIVIDLPMGADPLPLTISVFSPNSTETMTGPHENPARAFWIALSKSDTLESTP